ncbi:hypothetical protein [Rhizobium rhizogenes]|uniref:hypothetical protein n=1 Tax=Rhizobium rhizogenes TaxID=359 RepID=UPI0015725B12|nr:hypothetical protein [Rhizobium rhizogenes]NTF80530.1 hypothetical protein [Rhizobium rhizogenes]
MEEIEAQGLKLMTNTTAFDVLTPEEIARRITESSGVQMTGRTVWEKARRLGIAKKLGRSMLIAIDDIPQLLQIEKTSDAMPTVRGNLDLSKKALALLKRAQKKQRLARLARTK